MEPFLIVEGSGNSVHIRYHSAFVAVKKGRRSLVPKLPELIEGKSVSFSPSDSVRDRIESACCITDASLGGKSHSKSKICCVCGKRGLSDNAKDNKWVFKHLRNDCPGAPDLAQLLQEIVDKGQ